MDTQLFTGMIWAMIGEDEVPGTKTDFERELIALHEKYPGKLFEFVREAIGMYVEFKDVHGYDDDAAIDTAAEEVIWGTKAAIDLDDLGEL